jgi:NAD(P)-dependent dehydrogenase (short-subunit alcohol dehydrogenase family)
MGGVYLGKRVVPDMLSAGHCFISLMTGASAALRGRAGFASLAIAKASLRMLGQSRAREFHPKGILVHVIVDGQIDTPPKFGRGSRTAPVRPLSHPIALPKRFCSCTSKHLTPGHTKSTCGPTLSHFEKLCAGRVQFAIDLGCTLA